MLKAGFHVGHTCVTYLEWSKLGSHQFLDVLGKSASSGALYDVITTDVIVRRYAAAGASGAAGAAAAAGCLRKLWIDERRGCDIGSGGWRRHCRRWWR